MKQMLRIAAAYALCAAVAAAQDATSRNGDPPAHSVRLSIERVEPTAFGFDVTVKLTNDGSRPLTLALATELSGLKLQSLDVQQWDEKVGWESVGPCRDVPPSATALIPPHTVMQDVVPIFDITKLGGTGLCPHRLTHLGNRIRAILYFGFDDQRAFARRNASVRNVTSEVFTLPPQRVSQDK